MDKATSATSGASRLHSTVAATYEPGRSPTAHPEDRDGDAEDRDHLRTLRRVVESGTPITQMGYAIADDVDEIVNRAQAEIHAVTDVWCAKSSSGLRR
ncbi:hypothetical protein [Streptomyces sp. NPDC005303]|uniref:hypothetical protein n=1 Tax=Streptomyces sp. NPDC005303 TaxID=3155713 RepID=UPI0033ABF262